MNTQTLPSPKLLLRDHLAFAAMTAAVSFAFIAAMTIVYDIRSENAVNQSFWAAAVTGVAPPYALGIGIYLMVVTFPRYVLYGETRKRFVQRIVLFSVPFTVGLTLLALAGWLLEALLYRSAGWNHAVDRNHLFASSRDIPQFMLELFVTVLPWFAVGSLIGAIYLGPQRLLLAAIPLGIAGVALVGILLGLDEGPAGLVQNAIHPDKNIALAILMSLAVTVAALAATRAVTREMPIQNQKS